jgi:regulator of PEP synthase PpsR (kinase-PPPase family)
MARQLDQATQRQRTAYFVSDHTGISAQVFGQALLSRFNGATFRRITEPFVKSEEQAQELVAEINASGDREGCRPLVFMTLSNPALAEIVGGCRGLVLDLFGAFTPQLETELDLKASHEVGRFHGLADQMHYQQRIDAVNFAMTTDDGLHTGHYEGADIILAGVSRSGKTPTCLYLAIHFGIEAANYPLTPEDLEADGLPPRLKPFRKKVFGLTIKPERLHQIRKERRADSHYAALGTCQREVRQAESIFRRARIPYIDTSTYSIEEIAAHVMDRFELNRI